MSQPFDQQCKVPALRDIDEESGEFWISNPWEFMNSGENLSAYERNGIFLNSGSRTFHDISYISGADSTGDGRTVVGWDVTGDGMPELFVRQTGGGALLVFRNKFPQANWLQISLRGEKSNRFGIGAKLICETDGRRITRELYPIINFLGQSPACVHLGLGEAETVDRLTIRWPSGTEQELTELPGNRHYLVKEGEATPLEVIPGEAIRN